MSGSDPKPTTSDAELIESARSGDTSAFGELWLRHYRPAARVARQFTSIDADDLVSEAYARIFQRVLAGGGPTGAFRPYLYTTIRNLASTWGAASRDIQVDMIEDFEDERIPDDPAAWALDRTLTASAFRGLPERWQTVLWYTEVEGMDPHEVAPIMGITANSVAALSYRAREGLRKAWLQAHISDATASGECQWTMAHLGDHTRNGLSARDAERMTDHLADCAKCTIVSEEVDEVGSHLAMVMLPLLLGGVVGGTLLSQLAAPSSSMAAELIPAMPQAVEAVAGGTAVAAPVIAGALSMGAASSTGMLVGGFAVAAVLGTTIALGVAPPAVSDPPAVSAVAEVDPSSSEAATETSPADSGPKLTDPDHVPGLVGGTLDGLLGGGGGDGGGVAGLVDGVTDVVDDTVQDVVQTVTQPITLTVSVSGTGTPGASVALKAAGTVYATTTVGSNGSYSISAGGIPQAVGNISVVQTVDQSLLGGLIGGVLNVLKPLTVSSSSGGLPVLAFG